MPKIKCLECGKEFNVLASHLRKTHGMSDTDYRQRHQLPRGLALVSEEYSQVRRDIFLASVARGAVVRPDQGVLVDAARTAERPDKTLADKLQHRELLRRIQPGNHSRIIDGGRRANGRDAVREREYQKAYRAGKNGDSTLMALWINKYK